VENQKHIQKVYYLALFTVFYNILEGVLSVYFGTQEDSVALAGFGLDSFIEVFSALLVLWRFKGKGEEQKEEAVISRERRATFGIGVLFCLLAIITFLGSCMQLYHQTPPETTVPGTYIAILSLTIMGFLWWAKFKLAKQLDSITLLKDAQCTLSCMKLSVILLLGSLVYTIWPQIWWADSVGALLLSFFIGKEGLETIQAARSSEFTSGCGCIS